MVWTNFSAAIIRASHIHQLDSNNSIQLFIYLDKDSDYAEKLTEKFLYDKDISDLKNSDIGKVSSNFFFFGEKSKKFTVTNEIAFRS